MFIVGLFMMIDHRGGTNGGGLDQACEYVLIFSSLLYESFTYLAAYTERVFPGVQVP